MRTVLAVTLSAVASLGCEMIEYRVFAFTEDTVELPNGVQIGAGLEGSWVRSDSAGQLYETMQSPYRMWVWLEGSFDERPMVRFTNLRLAAASGEHVVAVPVVGEATWKAGPQGQYSELVANGLELEHIDYLFTGVVEISSGSDAVRHNFRLQLGRAYSEERRSRMMERLRS